jgi:hypothetical protein
MKPMGVYALTADLRGRLGIGTGCLVAGLLLLTGQATAQEFYGTLKKIKETNTITVGHREASIPFS